MSTPQGPCSACPVAIQMAEPQQYKVFVTPIGVLNNTTKRVLIDSEPSISWDDLMDKVFKKIMYPQNDMTLWRKEKVENKEKWVEFTKEKFTKKASHTWMSLEL